MPLVKVPNKKSRQSYSREEDEIIVRLSDQNTPIEEIIRLLKEAGHDRTKESVAYRIANILSKTYTYEDINYD